MFRQMFSQKSCNPKVGVVIKAEDREHVTPSLVLAFFFGADLVNFSKFHSQCAVSRLDPFGVKSDSPPSGKPFADRTDNRSSLLRLCLQFYSEVMIEQYLSQYMLLADLRSWPQRLLPCCFLHLSGRDLQE